MAAKLQDMQEITTTVAVGNYNATQVVNPTLQDASDTPVALAPTMVNAEVVNLTGGDATLIYAAVTKIVRAGTTFTATISPNAKIAAADAKVTVRYTSVYFHSLQGADVTP